MEEKGFKIPEAYFEAKKKQLKEIAAGEEKAGHRLRYLYWFAGAAALVLIFIQVILSEPADTASDLQSISAEVLQDYLSEDPLAIYPESFISLDSNTEANVLDNIDLESIESYLENNSHEYL